MSKKKQREEEQQKQLNDYTRPGEYEILKKQLEKLPNEKDTWFSDLGNGCIDTIFYSKGIRLNKYETIEANGASDHNAVFAEFDI